MKIIGVGRNYAAHAKELGNSVPGEPIIFLKPDTALLKNNAPFYFPEFTKEIDYEAELVVRINREGKNIQEQFAHKYYDELGVGIDFTARDLQQKAKVNGLPWALSKGFNGSAPISTFVSKSDFANIASLSFSLTLNGELRQKGNTSDMVHSIDKLISFCSTYFTLKNGDLIFTGTPAGVGAISIGDVIEVFLEEKLMLLCEIK